MKQKKLLFIALMIIGLLLLTSTFVQAKTVIVDTDTLRLRKEASKDSDTVALLENGDKLEYIEEDGEWYKVKVGENTGYVSKEYVKVEEDAKPEEPKTEPEKQPEPQPAKVEPVEMKVSQDSKIYILPLINANTIQEIKKDSNVKILSKTNGWYYVETDTVMGWIRQTSLVDSSVVSDDINVENQEENKEENKEDKEISEKTMYVNTSSAFVRKGPGTEYEDIDAVVLNEEVKVVGENGDWYKIEKSGTIGYIAKRLLSEKETTTTTRSETERNVAEESTENYTTSDSSLGGQIVAFAKQYLGCPYVYGASGPSSFDCSGFTMFVLDNFGIDVSHSATAQSKIGTRVAKDDLQPGDLVFFTDYETGYGIGHVGIYIGGGDFIHASSGTGYCVKISTLLSGSYYNRYETACRVY